MSDVPVYNAANDLIAHWSDDPKGCANPMCKKAIREGRTVHVIPSCVDPRQADWTLNLRNWHYATVEEAVAAIETGWETAIEVRGVEERDAAYELGVPVKIYKWADYR
jgi:hypothetical protein